MKLKKTLLIALFGVLGVCSQAQRHTPIPATPERCFEEGKQLFAAKNYPEASRLLQVYVKQKGLPYENVSEADYMLACSAYELKEPGCMNVLQEYLKEYPETPYRNRVTALMANAAFYQEKYAESIALFNRCDLDALPNNERDEFTLHKAIAHIETGDLREAYILLSVVEACSDSYRNEANFYKAYIDYSEKRYNQALPIFEGLRNNRTFGNEALLYIADIHLGQNKFAEAYEEIGRVRASSKNETEKERILGSALYGLGRYEQAITPLQAYADHTKKADRNALYRLGMAYYHTQAYRQAAETLEKVTYEKDALTQNAYLHIGQCYLALQNKPQARMAFEQAAGMNADSHVTEAALYNYALTLHETAYSAFGESVTVFERFLNEFPQSVYADKVNSYLIEVYLNTRSYEAALQSMAKIKQPGKRILEAKQKVLFQLGTQSFANADFKQAVDYFNQSLQLASHNRQTEADALYWRGEAQYRLGNYRQAEQDFKQYLSKATVSSGETYPLALYNLGYTKFKQKSYTEAGNWFSRFIDQTPNASNSIKADAYNRLADCRFYVRNFDEARRLYDQAATLHPASGDYALYQTAFVQGLQKDYVGKVASLNRLIDQFPQSTYVDDALYERGRAYIELENSPEAIQSFTTLVEKYPNSSIARKGAGEIGLLYYQNDKYPEAITAYKKVIAQYPGSEEALQAQRDLKSIYIDLNNVDEYANFIASQGGAALDNHERDSLNYVAAERVYMRGETEASKKSLEQYLTAFPNGMFQLNAHYYLGLINYNQQQPAIAQQHLDNVIAVPNNKFSEEAMVLGGELAFNAKNYAKALDIYKQLKEKTASAERLLTAQIGILRSAYLLKDVNETIRTANELLNHPKLTPELINEARYYRAKAALTNQPEQAIPDLTELAKDTRNIYGAEAKYLLAQRLYDQGQYAEAEKVLLEFIDMSTPHTYWLARGFILLSDVYLKLERKVEARQYLLSLQQNYQADDDIAGLIEERLKAFE